MSDFSDDFVVSENWNVPKPLDKYLATITIRNTANDLSNFNVVLNANFGRSTISIEVDDTTLEVDCELKQAEVRLYYSDNCSIRYGAGYARHRKQKRSVLEQRLAVSTELAAALRAEGQINPERVSAILAGKVSLQGDRRKDSTISSEQTLETFNHIQVDTVSITGDPLNEVLNGAEVAEYEGWTGTPTRSGSRIGLGATLLVKEDWIKFSKAKIRKPGRLTAIFQSIFQSEKSKKSEQFKILLAYLARRSLQDPNETRYATLACSAFVLEPATDIWEQVRPEEDLAKLVFHPALIEQFGSLPEGKHEAFVEAVVSANASPDADFFGKGHLPKQRIAAPKGTVFEALRALDRLVELNPERKISADLLKDMVPDNTRKDLSNLGILSSSKGRSIDTVRKFSAASATETLLYAASQTKWFVFVANLLEDQGIRLPSRKVGQALSDEYDLGWADSSCQRHGQNIKKWVVLLYPMFADLTKSHPDYFYIKSVKSEFDGRGANPIFTAELIDEIETLKRAGCSYSEITGYYGVSNAAFANWKGRNKERWLQVKQTAKGKGFDQDTKRTVSLIVGLKA